MLELEERAVPRLDRRLAHQPPDPVVCREYVDVHAAVRSDYRLVYPAGIANTESGIAAVEKSLDSMVISNRAPPRPAPAMPPIWAIACSAAFPCAPPCFRIASSCAIACAMPACACAISAEFAPPAGFTRVICNTATPPRPAILF